MIGAGSAEITRCSLAGVLHRNVARPGRSILLMARKCHRCGIRRKLAIAGLCGICLASGMPSDLAGSVESAPHNVVVMMALPPGDAEVPHVHSEQDTDHIGSPAMSAGGGSGKAAAFGGTAVSVSRTSGSLGGTAPIAGSAVSVSRAWGSFDAPAAQAA